jgi:Holliday junction resolvase
MVDPRAKGARVETQVKDKLREFTGLAWERVPSSGALDPKHGLKGDLYVPNEKNLYVVEVKGYADDHLTSSILTAKDPILIQWWEQATRQGKQVSKLPLLIFKYDRSKMFCAFLETPTGLYDHFVICAKDHYFHTCLLEDFLVHEKPKFIK